MIHFVNELFGRHSNFYKMVSAEIRGTEGVARPKQKPVNVLFGEPARPYSYSALKVEHAFRDPIYIYTSVCIKYR